ncbi:MAG: hypothetical protein QNK20_14955 [Aureibaculum sp.]|nr:hypothetical protein [Aureibaculum sp.]
MQFKIRSSAIGKIMAGKIGLSDNQKIDFDELSNKEKITPKQLIKLDALRFKKDNPELTEGAKTYCKIWLKEQTLNRGNNFGSKFTEKGNVMEDESIDFIAKMLNYGMLIKNPVHFENDFITGTPDILTGDGYVFDAKNSWDHETFPLFESKIPNYDYYWQLQGYMDLTKKDKAKLVYVLSNTPENLIEREARFYCTNFGYEDLDYDIYKKFADRMTYDDVEDKYRITVFEVNRNQSDIDSIYLRVKLCRDYIETLKSSL